MPRLVAILSWASAPLSLSECIVVAGVPRKATMPRSGVQNAVA